MYYNLASREESEPPQLCHEAENMSSTLESGSPAHDPGSIVTNTQLVESDKKHELVQVMQT